MKEELLKLIKVCEENRDLDLRITCEPVYSFEGEFITFKFYLDNYKSYDQLGQYIWGVKNDFKDKKDSIRDIIHESCHCEFDFDNFDDEDLECHCKLYTQEEAEEIHYNRILEKIKERLKFIKKEIGE